jgi:hypothetical protein
MQTLMPQPELVCCKLIACVVKAITGITGGIHYDLYHI